MTYVYFLQIGCFTSWLPEHEQSVIVMGYLYLMGCLLVECNRADDRDTRETLAIIAVCLTALLYRYITTP